MDKIDELKEKYKEKCGIKIVNSKITSNLAHRYCCKAIDEAVRITKAAQVKTISCDICFTNSWEPVAKDYKTDINTLMLEGRKFVCGYCELVEKVKGEHNGE